MGVLASGEESAGALTPPDLRVPTEVLDHCRGLFPSPWQMSTAFGGLALGPGAFEQRPAGLGVAGCGHRPVPASLGTGVCRGDQAQACHECSGGINAGQVAHVGPQGHGHGPGDAAPGLESRHHRGHVPRGDLNLPCWCETLASCGLRLNGMDLCWKDEWLSRGGADHCCAPPEGGWAPGGSAGGADIVPESARLEAQLGVLASTDGSVARAGAIPAGVICHRGDIDHRESTRAGAPGPWPGVAAVGFDPIAWCVGEQRGCHHPAVVALLRQSAIAPVATGTGCVDAEPRGGRRWHVAYEWIEVPRAGAHRSEIDDLSTMILSHRGDRHRVVVDIHAEVPCARLMHG